MSPIKSYYFMLIVFLFSSSVCAQELHTPSEVEQYMKKSSIDYQIDSSEVINKSISLPIIETGQFLVSNDNGIEIQKKETSLSKKAKKNRKKARKAAKKNNFNKAQKFYKKAIQINPNQPELIHEVADFYWENEKVEEMIFLEKQVVGTNPIDFIAHAKLAVAYQNIGNKEKALEHIILAHLYNRNHDKITQRLKSIFNENKMNYQSHVFDPQYQIILVDEKVVIQAQDAPWKSFATCKALWQNDENYRKEMGHLANVHSTQIEEKECLLNALITYNRMKTGKENFPLLDILGTSLTNGMVDDFILYEIHLRQDPNLIHLLPKEKVDRVIRYMKTIRVHRDVISE